jgi:hypothetical protein
MSRLAQAKENEDGSEQPAGENERHAEQYTLGIIHVPACAIGGVKRPRQNRTQAGPSLK